LLFAFQFISVVSRPDIGQLVFKNSARILAMKTFFNVFFERVQKTIIALLVEIAI
jgi:hypothetical protein